MQPAIVWSLFDIETWDRAKWRATLFMSYGEPGVPPCLGIAFEDGAAGKEVFRQLRAAVGDDDVLDELRLSIIEGDIPGQQPGYSVHVLSEPVNTAKRMHRAPVVGPFNVASKVHRMNPHPGSPYLGRFKQDFSREGRYLLIPATFDKSTESASPHVEFAIGKHHVHFRQASDIARGDIDAYVVYGDVQSRYLQ